MENIYRLTHFDAEKSLGFSMSTGDVSDLVSVLTNLREELLSGLVSLRREDTGEQSSKLD